MDDFEIDRMQNPRRYWEMLDSELVAMCQRGDQRAFAELIGRHQTTAMKVALSIVRDRLDAEDEVQNAFWKAYQHISNFQQDSKFSTWLTRIVVNQCLMKLRQSKRVQFAYIDDEWRDEEIVTLELKDFRKSPEQALGQTEVAKVLEHEIKKTPPLLRNAFLLRDVEKRPMREVAERLGISVAAAKSRLLRARAELRERMKRHYGGSGPATLMTD